MDIKVILCVLVSTVINYKITEGIPITSCPANTANNYYISDSFNRCVFYWCLKGKLVRNIYNGFTYNCPNGFGTSIGARGGDNICSRQNLVCKGGNTGGNPNFPTTQSTSTTATPDPGKQITQFLPGYHALHGKEQPFLKTVKDCFMQCLSDVSCYAFDFNSARRTCWFHTSATACSNVVQKKSCTHYRFITCATTQSATSDTTTTLSSTVTTQSTTSPILTTTLSTTTKKSGGGGVPLIQTFSGRHLLGGKERKGISTAYECLSKCFHDGDCAGVDFDNRTEMCFFHNITTECTQMVMKPYCTHWRLTDKCTATAPVTTSSTDAPTMDQTTQPQPVTQTPTGTPPPTTQPGGVPTGFVEMVSGMHLLGGQQLLTGATLEQCLDACLMSSFCLAVDYNTITKICYAHNTTTYCSQSINKPACRHYKRAPCLPGTRNDIAEVRNKFHVPGGLEVCTGCSVEQCLLQCSSSLLGLCQGVDYDDRNKGCYVHRATTVCNPLQAKDFCTHYSRVVCTSQGTVTQAPNVPVGIPAPVGPFMVINFMGPKSLPSGWSAYPGMTILSGNMLAGPGIDGEACIRACADKKACKAVDFNSHDGTCWEHDDASKCDILDAANEMYHMKKPPVCSFFPGTTVPYPTPFATAP